MNVKQLREQLVGIPDEALLVVNARDHSFRLASVSATSGWRYPDGDLSEYFDGAKDAKKIPVLLFS